MFSERILHEHVPINAYKSEEEHAGVEVSVKHVPVDYAEHISIDPVLDGVASHQRWKSAQKN